MCFINLNKSVYKAGMSGEKIADTVDFLLEDKTKMFHGDLCVFIIVSALLYLLHVLSFHKSFKHMKVHKFLGGILLFLETSHHRG